MWPDKHLKCRIGGTGDTRGRDSLVLGRRVILSSLEGWIGLLMMAGGTEVPFWLCRWKQGALSLSSVMWCSGKPCGKFSRSLFTISRGSRSLLMFCPNGNMSICSPQTCKIHSTVNVTHIICTFKTIPLGLNTLDLYRSWVSSMLGLCRWMCLSSTVPDLLAPVCSKGCSAHSQYWSNFPHFLTDGRN